MTTKVKLIIGGVALLLGLGIWNKFTTPPIPIGAPCEGLGSCPGECLAMGNFKPDDPKICTQECKSSDDCPAPTSCETITRLTTDGSGGSDFEEVGYCLAPRSQEPAE